MPRLDLAGASAVVTGGASGIGAAAARQLAHLGVRVVVADLDLERGDAVAAEVGGVAIGCDVTSEADGLAAVSAAAELGPLRVLVNSAGIGPAARTVDRNGEPMPQKYFDKVVAVNLLGTFNMLRLAAAAIGRTEPVDADGQRGVIVNVASVAAFDGQIGQAAYAASKGGVVGMTLPVARDLSSVGIRVNTVAPGLVDTPIYGTGDRAEEFKGHLGTSVLFPKRLGVAEELAFAIVDLVTNPYVNGEVLRVDGGIRMPPK